MTATVSLQPPGGIPAAGSANTEDAEDLAGFGYPQQLRRRLGSYASFAAGFSFVSILTTVFQLFAFGFSFGGPAFFWTWPMVFVGQLMVAPILVEYLGSSGSLKKRLVCSLASHHGWTEEENKGGLQLC